MGQDQLNPAACVGVAAGAWRGENGPRSSGFVRGSGRVRFGFLSREDLCEMCRRCGRCAGDVREMCGRGAGDAREMSGRGAGDERERCGR